jgi:enoyl-CoA hydratase/carnithine racemase
MALLCDLRFSTSDAAFALPETRLGLIPAAGGSQSIARVAGPSRGLYTMLTGERMSATQALAWRIVDRIEVDVDCAALAVARQVARLAPESSRIGKQAIRAGLDLSRGAGLIAERRYARLLASLEA